MPKKIDIIGRKFHHLTVEKYSHRKGRSLYYHCLCSCGRRTTTRGSDLRAGRAISCGCAKPRIPVIHGRTYTPEFRVWLGMRNRCYNPTNGSYKNYGGRGIKVCEEWMNNFQSFYNHVGPRPSPRHQLDRYPDNNGNYEPGNVRWATPSENNLNRRDNRRKDLGYQE